MATAQPEAFGTVFVSLHGLRPGAAMGDNPRRPEAATEALGCRRRGPVANAAIGMGHRTISKAVDRPC